MTRAFSQFKIENDGNYALFVTSSDHPGAIRKLSLFLYSFFISNSFVSCAT